MLNIEYKTYRPEYAEGVQSVALGSWMNTYQGIFSEVFIKDFVQKYYSPEFLNDSLPRIANGREFFEVALDDGSVIGYCHIGDGGHGWELLRIYLSPRYIGQGVGKALLAHGEAFLGSKGAEQYFCFVHEKNEMGKNFYQRNGFRHIPDRDQDDEWYLEKILPPTLLENDLSETLSLDGEWQFSLGDESLSGTIQVPGCWEAQGYAKSIDGPAVYRRSVRIPMEWAGQQIRLEFGAVSYACEVFCNGNRAGEHIGLWTPFSLDLSQTARPGEDNQLEVVVYKPGQRYPMRSSLAGFLPDVATTFGGLWQPVRLRALSCALADARMSAEYAERSIRVQCRAVTLDGELLDPVWQVEIHQGEQRLVERRVPWSPDGRLDCTISLPDARPWSPEAPGLFTVTATLLAGDRPAARFSRRTGFRLLSADGDQLLLNGSPFMARGILSWGWDPERIAPYYTPEQAREEMRRAREMGFNLIKLCLFVPNPVYFDIADEEGLLLWEELPMWLPEVSAELRERAPLEYAEIVQRMAHHPSVALYSLGCELSQAVDSGLLDRLNRAVRERVRDVLLCDNSGSGESYGGLDFDFSDFTDYHPYYDLQYFEPLLDNWRRDWQAARPWIFGEFCDSDTFRDQNEIIQANGGKRPWWLTNDNPVTTWRSEAVAATEWEPRLEQAQPGFSPQDIVRISHQQSYVIRKYTLEALRRRRGMGGYIITGLRDTPISTSGVWDDLGRAKWPARDFCQINDDAILILDVGRRRLWRNGGDRPDRLDPHNFWAGDPARWYVILSNTGPAFRTGARLDWTLSDPSGQVAAAGSSRLAQDTRPGMPGQVGVIQCTLPEVERAVELTLNITLAESGRRVSNHWPVWVYPRLSAPPQELGIVDPQGLLSAYGDWLKPVPRFPTDAIPGGYRVLITTGLDENLWRWIEHGGRVLLLQQGDGPLPARRCPFWREAIKLFPDHPLWESFPQRGYTDLQFFGLAADLAFDIAGLPAALPPGSNIRPILRRLDAREFHMSEYIFEARVGAGMLLACTLRLQGGQGAQPEGWMRNVAGAAMLQAMLNYI